MKSVRLISTDFDGTAHSELEQPPVPLPLQQRLADLQAQGVKWLINTGRDLNSLGEALRQANLEIRPDFLVVAEREIYVRGKSGFRPHPEWNDGCTRCHATLFEQLRPHLPIMSRRIQEDFGAMVYADAYSPISFVAASSADADRITEFLTGYRAVAPALAVMRNDIYARLCHEAYHKGTALREVSRLLGLGPEQVVAAGDHFNDLPMLSTQFAGRLIAPANAIPAVKAAVTAQGGYVSGARAGWGLLEGLGHFLARETVVRRGRSPARPAGQSPEST